MFLLDTMVISEETKRSPHAGATSWFRQIEPDRLFLSVASIAEIRRGIGRQQRLDRPFADRLEGWLRQTERRFGSRVLVVDAAIARLWGELWDRLGFNSPDLIIAATAHQHDLVVVTRNLRHFEQMGVRLLDPYRNSN
jgi:predicted nucleic acid-binding protein